jgi:DNA-binding NarL/FixJ family response regulator
MSESAVEMRESMANKILIVDDQPMVRQGVRALIHASHPDWEICGEASNGKEAFEVVRTLKPDVIILDILMPEMDGFELASKLSNMHSGSRIVVFTMHESRWVLEEVRKSGAQGYVVKSHAGRDLIRAIDTVQSGGTFFESHADFGGH